MIVLETPRLVLRRPRLGDLDDLHSLYGDPEIRRHFPEGVLDREQTRAELEWFLNGHPRDPRLGLWATVHKGTGAFIGRCGLLPWEIGGRPEVEVAYLLDKAYWGQGLASEAARGIARHAFEVLGLTRLVCLIDPDNHASRRVAERIGMSLVRELDGVDGDGVPTLLFAMTKGDAGVARRPGHG